MAMGVGATVAVGNTGLTVTVATAVPALLVTLICWAPRGALAAAERLKLAWEGVSTKLLIVSAVLDADKVATLRPVPRI